MKSHAKLTPFCTIFISLNASHMAGEDDERLQRFLDADPGAKLAYEKRIEQATRAIMQVADAKMQVADAKVALAEQAVLGACEVLIASGRCEQLPVLEYYLQRLRHAQSATPLLTVPGTLQNANPCTDPGQSRSAESIQCVPRPIEGNKGGHRRIPGQRCHPHIPGMANSAGAETCGSCAGQIAMCDNAFRKSLVTCWFLIGMRSVA